MTDGVIKGTGNSRYLKIPANAKALYPDTAAILDAMIAGTFAFDLNGINPDGWSQQGTPLNKDNLLANNTCYALKISKTATVNQALQRLAVGIGKYGFLIHLRLADGTPLPGATISGLTSITGGAVVTDSNGDAFGTATTSPVAVSVTSIWLDVNNVSKSIYGDANGLSEQTLTMTQKSVNSVIQITSSKTVKFAKAHNALVCCVQGGTGGQAGNGYLSGQTSFNGGSGGSQGKIHNATTTLAANANYPATIGAGGAGGPGSLGITSEQYGSPGGESSFAGISSTDGSTSALPLNDSTLNIGGKGGKGGTGNTYIAGGSGSAGIKAGGGGGGGQGHTGSSYQGGTGGTSPAGSAGQAPPSNSGNGGKGGEGGPGGGGGGGGGTRGGGGGSGGSGGKGGPGIVLIKLLS